MDGIHPKGFPPLYSEWDSLQGGPLLQVNGFTSRASPSPPLMNSLHGGPLLQSEWDSSHGGPPYPGGPLLQVNEIHLKGLPLSTANGIRFKGVPFSKVNGIRLKGVPLSNANESRLKGFPPLQCEWDSLQGGPLLQSEWYSLPGIPPLHSDSVSLQGTLLHLDISTHPLLHLWITPLRDPICGLLLPSIFPSKGDKEADESSLTAPVKAMILSSNASRMPRSHLTILRRDLSTSLPMQELQSLRFPQDRFSPSALRCQMPSLTHNRDSLIALRMEGYAVLCCLLSASSRRSPIRLFTEGS